MWVCGELFFPSSVGLPLFYVCLLLSFTLLTQARDCVKPQETFWWSQSWTEVQCEGDSSCDKNILLMIWRIKHTGFWNVLWRIRREDSPDEEGLGVPTRCSHTPVLVVNTVMRWLSPRLSHWLSPSSTVRNYVASIMSVYFPWIPRHDAISTT